MNTEHDDGEKIGLIEISPHLDRMVSFKEKRDGKEIRQWYFIEDIIIDNLKSLYPGIIFYDITAFRMALAITTPAIRTTAIQNSDRFSNIEIIPFN